MHVIVGAVCLADGLEWLRSLAGARTHLALRAVAGCILLVIASVTAKQLRMRLQSSRARYAAYVPVGLPGTARLRLPKGEVIRLNRLTEILRQRADTFLCVPGFSSLYFWTGKEPPTLDVIGHVMGYYPEARQAAMVNALLQHSSPMVVRILGLAPPYPPFDERLNKSFTPLMTVDQFQLLVPRDWHDPLAVGRP